MLFAVVLTLTSAFICGKSGINITDDMIDDGYCDCPEHTDEPHTSACATDNYIIDFTCQNKGWYPQTISTSQIGDGICDCIDGTDEIEGIKRKENETIANIRDDLITQGRKIAEDGLSKSYVANSEIEKMRRIEKEFEKQRINYLKQMLNETIESNNQELINTIKNAMNYFVIDTSEFGLTQQILTWLRPYDVFGLLGNSNPEGINDNGYIAIRQKLAQIRNLISENDSILAKRFIYNSAIISGDYCTLPLEGICLKKNKYQLCLEQNLTKNGNLIGKYKGHLGNFNFYSGGIDKKSGNEYRAKLVIRCGNKNDIDSINDVGNGNINIL
ncbi:Glucosidase II beta subunit [Entamoeba marina]